MGIESDKLVYDYLGKVADLAQASMAADERARLVAGLRRDIEEKRSGRRDHPAAVRRVLAGMGAPEEVVQRASRDGVPTRSVPAVPLAASPPSAPSAPLAYPAPASPSARAAPARQSAPGIPAPRQEWWRVPEADQPEAVPAQPRPVGPMPLPGGFAGWDGFEFEFDFDGEGAAEPAPAPADARPEKPGPQARPAAEPAAAPPAEPGPAPEAEPAGKPAGRWRGRGRGRLRGAGRPLLLETLAAVLLLAGVVVGSLLPMLLGWLAAYASRSLSILARKFAVLGIPALTVLGAGVWLWGRSTGRWGGPLPDDQLGQSVKDLVPLVVRVAACGSAVFLAWYAFRRRPAE
jgi:hypothetical protein